MTQPRPHLAAVPAQMTPAQELEFLDPEQWSRAARELDDAEQRAIWQEIEDEAASDHTQPRTGSPELDTPELDTPELDEEPGA